MSQGAALCWFLLVLLICTCNATEKPQQHVHVDESACKDCTICQYPYCINNQPVSPLPLPPPPPSLPLPPPLPPPYQVNCQPPPAAPADCCPQNMGTPPPPPVYYTYPEPSAASEPPLMKFHTSLFSCFVVSLHGLITFVVQAA